MQTQSINLWWLRTVTFLVAAVAAASATFWVLKWTSPPPSHPSAAVIFSEAPTADPQAIARLLGGGQVVASAAPLASAASRFKLTGVIADRAQGGYALISVDGKPAKPYRVGAQIDDGLVLQSVAPRSAALAARLDAPASLTLELPKLNRP
jgi:general secretion pathway protein C